MTRRLARVLALVFLLAGAAFAELQPSTLVANVPGRSAISLNGRWRSIVDPYETGVWTHFERNAKPRDKSELVEYDFDQSALLAVPADWNSQRDDLFLYEGSVWYKTSFAYHKREHTRQFLYFGGANYRATVFLNGKKLGEHVGGFTPFNFEVTDTIAEGDNLLVVQVNDARHADAIPALDTDWWNYGGLTRDVSLVDVPETFVQDYFIQLAKGRQNEIAGWVQLNGVGKSQQVTVEIPEAKIKQVVTTDANGRAEFRFPAKLALWSPESPKLYDVVVSTPTDSVRDSIGFRTIETRGTQIVLNGKPFFLRGISIHEEAPYRGGRAVSPEDDQTLLGWAKELGCNFIRLAHYPHNEHMVRLADKLGLLVWSEVPVYWGNAWQNPATLENAEAQLRDNIARDHNRASVVFWSVANETPIQPGRLEFLKQLIDEARRLDSTRLLTAAMNTAHTSGPNTNLLDDPLGQYLDVLGWNEYLGWYGGKPEDADRTEWKTSYDKPLIISEFGGGAVFGRHGDADTRWTEEYQASIFEHQIKSLSRIPSLAGMSPWVLMDFRSPRRQLPGVQDFRNRKGVVSDRGERKKAFYVLQKFYKEKSGQ
jgi:beta-glucuronidase